MILILPMLKQIPCSRSFGPMLLIYKGMHQTLPGNDIPYPFAFNPLPFGNSVPVKQTMVKWELPSTQMPANKNELAFYSIPQLASLVKNKKISSVELTKFFIDRLKKWGDTLNVLSH